MKLHPAWPERESLTALIASAHESHQRPIPPFRVPPEPSLPPVPLTVHATSPADRARMAQLIQTRIQQDFDAVKDRVDREVARFRETERAAAEKEVQLEAETRAPEFQQQYQAEAARYASQIAPLQLRLVGLLPHPSDPILLTPAQRDEHARQLAQVQNQINQLLGERDAHLKALQDHYQADLAAARQRLLTAADERVARYREERLGALETTGRRQQEQIQADLERSLQMHVALPEVVPPLPGPTAAGARALAAATSASALATMERYHDAARDIEHSLFVQRDQLDQLIAEATRAAVVQLARANRIDVRFAPSNVGPDLTSKFADWLRARWQTNDRRSGVQAFRKATQAPHHLNA